MNRGAEQPAGVRDSAVFQVVDLTKVYAMGEVQVHALRGVTLDIDEGQLLVLLGHSGSGKSTLLNIIGGLDVPSSGHVFYRGREMTTADERALTEFRRRNVGFVFQFYNLIPSLTARENVDLVTEVSDNPLSSDEALTLMGLADRLDHFPAQMSGGEQQRVAIARAIAKRPDVLLCDEPTGDLDRRAGDEILDLLQALNREHGKTIVMVTHDPHAAARARRVLYLDKGVLATEPAA